MSLHSLKAIIFKERRFNIGEKYKISFLVTKIQSNLPLHSLLLYYNINIVYQTIMKYTKSVL